MRWITDPDSSHRRIALVTPDCLGVFYDGEYSTDEIRSEIDAGVKPTSFSPGSGDFFSVSEIEYLAYDPSQQSLKIGIWGGSDGGSRFVNQVTQVEADQILEASLEQWQDFKINEKEHLKAGRLFAPVIIATTIFAVFGLLWAAYDRGTLSQPSGGGRTRTVMVVIGAFFQFVGKPGILLIGGLAILYPIYKCFTITGSASPMITIVHRSDLRVSVHEALDRETPMI